VNAVALTSIETMSGSLGCSARPQGAALDQARRDGVRLIPAVAAAMGLDDSVLQIAHFFSFSFCPTGARRPQVGMFN
jgi:hypothetical protein